MPDLNDADLFLVERPAGADAGTYKLRKDNLVADLLDADLMLVERSGESFKATGKDVKDSFGAGAPAIVTAPTLVATPNTWPSSLTATTAIMVNATQDLTYAPWFKDDVQIAGSSGLTYTATSSGRYKYQERWVGDNGTVVDPPPQSAQVDIGQPIVATPSVIAPENGAGVGGDVTYTPMTSQINNNAPISGGGWLPSPTTLPTAYWFICWGSYNRFVGVGSNQSMWSNDGIYWTPSTPALDPSSNYSGNWGAVVYGESPNSGSAKYVAVGYNPYGGMMYSADGITWAFGEQAPLMGWNSIAYGNGVFVACSDDPFNSGSNRFMYSNSGVNFVSSNNKATTDLGDWMSVTFGAPAGSPKFIAVAKAGTNRIVFSTDGVNWAVKAPPADASDVAWYSVAYGNGKYVAVGQSSSTNKLVMYSTDGSTWQNSGVTGVPVKSWSSITFGGGRFVAVAMYSDVAMSSTDGINWTTSTAISAANWQSIAYGSGVYAVTSGGTEIMYSTTGLPPVTTLAFDDANTYNLDGGADMGVPISDTFSEGQTVYAQSDSSITGTLVSDASSNTMTLENVTGTWGNTMRVVNNTQATQAAPDPDALEFVGSVPAAATGTISTWGNASWSVTTGGVAQTQIVGITPGVQQTLNVADAADITLVGGTTYEVTVNYAAPDCSPDTSAPNTFKTGGLGPGWFPASTPESNNWQSVIYGNGSFVGVASNGTNRAMYSNDGGLSWSSSSKVEASSWYSVTYGNGKFVAVAFGGTSQAMYSADGINWAYGNGVPLSGWRSVTYGDGKYVAVAQNGTQQVMYSADGVNWSGANASAAVAWVSVIYGGNKFVAVGYNAVMLSVNGGLNWNSTPAAQVNTWQSVTYGSGKFVAVSSDGINRVMYSFDGLNWASAPVEASQDGEWSSVTYGNGKFVAVASGGTNQVMYSADGISWTSASPTEAYQWMSVTYGGGKFVAVAQSGVQRVMWSITGTSLFGTKYYDTNAKKAISGDGIVNRFGIEPDSNAAVALGFAELTVQPSYAVSGYELQADGKYKPLRNLLPEISEAASAWAQSTSYTIGQIVLYNGNLYQVTVAHTSSSSFNVSDFELIGAED